MMLGQVPESEVLDFWFYLGAKMCFDTGLSVEFGSTAITPEMPRLAVGMYKKFKYVSRVATDFDSPYEKVYRGQYYRPKRHRSE